MIAAIVGVEFQITSIEAKWKLPQKAAAMAAAMQTRSLPTN
jgi:predicted FMN-binding regulatory protein PaiB